MIRLHTEQRLRRVLLVVSISMISTLAVLEALGDQAIEAPQDFFLPCEPAAEVVSATLTGDAPSDLHAWPLYEIELEVSPADHRIVGRMQISLASPADDLASVFLNEPPFESRRDGPPLRIADASVKLAGQEEFQPTVVRRIGTRVELGLPRALRGGEQVVLLLTLEGRLARRGSGTLQETVGILRGGARGIGRVGAVATDGAGITLLGAHPTLAAFRDGAFVDLAGVAWGPREPAPPACHIMSVLAPSGLSAFSTGDQVGAVPESEGRVRHTFVAAGARRMGVVLRPNDIEVHERRYGGVRVRAGASEAKVAEEMTRWSVGVLRVYEQRYGPYPWTKLEIVEVPMTGAMAGLRAPGVVAINDIATSGSKMLAGLGPVGNESFMQEVAIAHQLAHQWFGEMIDTSGVESPAVEEALAWNAVLEYARTRHGVEASKRIKNRIVNLAFHTWRLMGGSDAPAGASLGQILEFGGPGAYLGLCDGKAPGLMEALAVAVGRDSLRRALRRHSDENRFGVIDRASLTAAIARAAPENGKGRVEPLFVRWLDEMHGDEDLGDARSAVAEAAVGELGGGMDEALIQEIMEQMLKDFGGILGP